jgi:hypothetical protein
MWDDDDDDNDDGMSQEEYRKLNDERRTRLNNLPVYKKALEILELSKNIVGAMDEEKDTLELRAYMMENAYIIAPKIAGAFESDSYVLSMENAVIIKRAARELQAQTSLAKEMELIEGHYLQLLRDEIEAFRLLFVEWIKTFDSYDKYNDGWGIFTEGSSEE